jgi:hypothetical protein
LAGPTFNPANAFALIEPQAELARVWVTSKNDVYPHPILAICYQLVKDQACFRYLATLKPLKV